MPIDTRAAEPEQASLHSDEFATRHADSDLVHRIAETTQLLERHKTVLPCGNEIEIRCHEFVGHPGRERVTTWFVREPGRRPAQRTNKISDLAAALQGASERHFVGVLEVATDGEPTRGTGDAHTQRLQQTREV